MAFLILFFSFCFTLSRCAIMLSAAANTYILLDLCSVLPFYFHCLARSETPRKNALRAGELHSCICQAAATERSYLHILHSHTMSLGTNFLTMRCGRINCASLRYDFVSHAACKSHDMSILNLAKYEAAETPLLATFPVSTQASGKSALLTEFICEKIHQQFR